MVASIPKKLFRTPHGYYDDILNQRKRFNTIGQDLNIKHLDQWYDASTKDIVAAGGRKILDRYNDSISLTVSSIYNGHSWLAYRFRTVPRRFWDVVTNQRQKFDSIGEILHVHTLSEWHHVTADQASALGARRILDKYGGTLQSTIQNVYPEIQKQPWTFRVPQAYWLNFDNQQAKFQQVAENLGVKTYSQWYNIDSESIERAGGRPVLDRYNRSVSQTVEALYPNYDWVSWRFKRVPVRHWDKVENQKRRIDFIGKLLNVKTLDQWYNITTDTLIRFGARSIIDRYNKSITRTMKTIYPSYSWQFGWTSKAIVTFLKTAEESLLIDKPELWCRVSMWQVRKLGGGGLIDKFPMALSALYPNHPWRKLLSAAAKKSEQRWLLESTKSLF